MALEKGIRLNKYLSDAGVCSRREADRLIEAGEVLVDGIRAVMGQQVFRARRCLRREAGGGTEAGYFSGGL